MSGIASSGLTSAAGVVLLFCVCAIASARGDDVRVVLSDAPVLLEIGDVSGDSIRVFINHADYTALASIARPGQLQIDTSFAPLPAGEHTIKVYRVNAFGEWLEWQSTSIRVRGSGGFDSAEFLPRLSLENEGRTDYEAHGDAFEPDPATYQDLNAQVGFSASLRRDEFSMQTQLNAFGASRRERNLRFAELGKEAPKLDLADYNVTLNYKRAQLQLGHVTYGDHPLLMQSVGNRGIGLRAQVTRRIDFTLSRQNGSRVVGYHHLLGEMDTEHSITGSTIGIEAVPDRPGLLRAELSWMEASVRNENDFGIGTVQDAEESRGVGATLTGQLWEDRLRLSLAWARSDYTNPEDPLLSQGFGLVPVVNEENEARRASVSLDVIRNLPLTERLPFSLSLTATHDEADPLYRSLAAFAQADNQQNRYGFNAILGVVNINMNFNRSEDNLDDIPSILKTRTVGQDLSVNLPLPELFRDEQGQAGLWIPSLNYSNTRVHQFAANNPDASVSGFDGGSHLPNQLSRSQSVGLSWSFNRVQFGWNLSRSRQDNRQLGRENADFENRTNGINVSWNVSAGLNLNMSLARTRIDNQEQHLKQYSDSGNLSLDWRFLEHWNWNLNVASNRGHDNADVAENRAKNLDARLSRNVFMKLPLLGETSGNLFVSYSRTDDTSVNRAFDFRSRGDSWAVNTGISLDIF